MGVDDLRGEELAAELRRRAQAIRDRQAAADPGVRDALDQLTEKVAELGDLAGEVSALRDGLAAAISASEIGEDPPPRRHLHLVRGEEEAS